MELAYKHHSDQVTSRDGIFFVVNLSIFIHESFLFD